MSASSILAGGTIIYKTDWFFIALPYFRPHKKFIMPETLKKPELLAPAGNFEKLEIAIHYGADAVYLAGKDFSLRNFSGNFTDDELKQAVRFARKRGVKVYLACNVYSRSHEQARIESFLKEVENINPHGIILSDPGIIMKARQIIPQIDIHLSTQANTTNDNAVEFWARQGVKRVNLARELSLEEIKTIISNTNIETETFVHGAMCISYSGRCLLSSFFKRQRQQPRSMQPSMPVELRGGRRTQT